ncbi:DNA polymerase [Leptolyngbya sp. AN03gr2]|uniref:DNA polymerase n=1 Tax=Leptolyngbya sp. AN03gr2 TaxID=3423364 RepID=UPI003D31C0EF
MIAAVWSGDPTMIDVYRQPEEMTAPDGSIVKNPLADLHTLTTKDCCFPHLFIDDQGNVYEQWRWVTIAEDGSLITQKGTPRLYGKLLNFGILYGQGAESVSDLHTILVALAEEWIKRHKMAYQTFHEWKEEVSSIAEARGWFENPFSKRVRWCVEGNAKGAGESPGVMAVNHAIQSSGADLLKISLIQIQNFLLSHDTHPLFKQVKIIGQVHDEILLQGPGRCYLDFDKSKWKEDVIVKPVWKHSDEIQEWVSPLKQIMIDAETHLLGGVLTGRVGEAVCPYWSK